MKRVVATVKSGKCNQGFHKVGDAFVIKELTPKGMCTSAFDAIFPLVFALQTGGEFFWERNPHSTRAACPDDSGIVFEIRLAEEKRGTKGRVVKKKPRKAKPRRKKT